MNKRNFLLFLMDFLFAVVVPSVIVIYFLGNLIFGKGYVFYGDEQWPIYVYKGMLNSIFYSWSNGYPTSSSTFFYSLIVYILIKIFGTYNANHIFVFLIPFLSGFIAYFSIKWTLKLYGYKGFIIQLSAALGALFYIANWQDPNLITPLYTWGFSYIITPILIFLLLKIFMEHKKSDMLIFSIVSIFGDSVPMWILTLGLFVLISMLLKLGARDRINGFLTSLRDITILIIFTILANSYFIIQSIAGFLLGAGGQYLAYSSTSSSITVAKTSSVLNLLDVFVYGQSKYYFFGLNPKNWTIINFALPISIILFVLIVIFIEIEPSIEKIKGEIKIKFKYSKLNEVSKTPITGLIISLLLVLFISLFLSKGFNPPVGRIYYLVLYLSPPGIEGITRDVAPFLMISSLAYSFLFSIIILFSIKNLLCNFNNKRLKYSFKNMVKKSFPFLILLLLLMVSIFGVFQETSVNIIVTDKDFSPTFLPESINSTVTYLNSIKPSGNIMWMPTGGTYPWKNNSVLTDFGANLVSNSSTPFYLYTYLFKENGTHIGILLDLSNTEYLVYNTNASFAFNYPVTLGRTQILYLLKNQTDLKLVKSIKGLYIFKNLVYKNTLLAQVPAIGNSKASVFNITSLVNGSDMYVTNQNPYIDLFCSNIISPEQIIENKSNLPLIQRGSVELYKNDYLKTNYDYNSSVFSIHNYSFVNGNLVLYLKYSIPPYLVNRSGNGIFNPRFSVDAYLYSSKMNLPILEENQQIIYESLGPKSQIQYNNNSGIISFELPDHNGNIGLSYYFSGFQTASPLYYIGTLSSNKINVNPLNASLNTSSLPVFSSSGNLSSVRFEKISKPILIDKKGISLIYSAYILYQELYVFKHYNLNKLFSTFNFYIVPVYYVNSTEGNALIIKKETSTSIIDKNKTKTLYLNTPYNGTYHVVIKVGGIIHIKGLGNISGNRSFNLTINGTYTLGIKALETSSVYINAYLDRNENSTVKGDIHMINPVQYCGNINGNGTILLVLPVKYSNMWVLQYNGNEYEPISLYGGVANGYILFSPNGKFSITYKMQEPLEIGYVISFTFVFIAALALILMPRVRRRK